VLFIAVMSFDLHRTSFQKSGANLALGGNTRSRTSLFTSTNSVARGRHSPGVRVESQRAQRVRDRLPQILWRWLDGTRGSRTRRSFDAAAVDNRIKHFPSQVGRVVSSDLHRSTKHKLVGNRCFRKPEGDSPLQPAFFLCARAVAPVQLFRTGFCR
jgi:hypothetical protein